MTYNSTITDGTVTKLISWLISQPKNRILTIQKLSTASNSQFEKIDEKISEVLSNCVDNCNFTNLTTYNFTDVAKMLGIGRKSLYRLVDEEKVLPFVQFGRSRRITHEAIVSFLRAKAA